MQRVVAQAFLLGQAVAFDQFHAIEPFDEFVAHRFLADEDDFQFATLGSKTRTQTRDGRTEGLMHLVRGFARLATHGVVGWEMRA